MMGCSEKVDSKGSSESLKVLDEVKNMRRLDLPMGLILFFGKERAKKIKNKEEEGLSGIERLRVNFGNIICSHLQKQVERLQQAHFNFDG